MSCMCYCAQNRAAASTRRAGLYSAAAIPCVSLPSGGAGARLEAAQAAMGGGSVRDRLGEASTLPRCVGGVPTTGRGRGRVALPATVARRSRAGRRARRSQDWPQDGGATVARRSPEERHARDGGATVAGRAPPAGGPRLSGDRSRMKSSARPVARRSHDRRGAW
eukprot:353102-Chlamydomonas_euryale.AAC.3